MSLFSVNHVTSRHQSLADHLDVGPRENLNKPVRKEAQVLEVIAVFSAEPNSGTFTVGEKLGNPFFGYKLGQASDILA